MTPTPTASSVSLKTQTHLLHNIIYKHLFPFSPLGRGQIFILTSQFPFDVWRFFISLTAHFEKKGISWFVDKNIMHTNTYKIFGYLEDKALYLWLIGLFNALKGNQLCSFLYWNPVFVDCFASGWALGEKLPKVGRCTALSPLSPSFSQLVQETVAALGIVLGPLGSPSPNFSHTKGF